MITPDVEAAARRQVLLAGKPATIEGRSSDPYFQNVEGLAATFGTLAALAGRHAAAGGLVLDIGANIGLSTIVLARACPGARIMAFEPSPVSARFLRRNVAANDIANVTVHELAVSDTEGELAFHEGQFGAGSHVVSGEHLGEGWATVRVPMMSLDEALRREGGGTVTFAKIDAEGHEPNILAGARRTLERDAPLLYMEFNAWCLNAFGGHSPAAFARALWRAFTVSRAGPDGALCAAAAGPIEFLYGNLVQHGCIDDLVLQLRAGVEFPSLMEMSWPGEACEAAAALGAASSRAGLQVPALGDPAAALALRARAAAAAARRREAAAEERIAALETSVARCEAEHLALRAWAKAVKASTSWQVTAPLRAAGRLARRLRGGR